MSIYYTSEHEWIAVDGDTVISIADDGMLAVASLAA